MANREKKARRAKLKAKQLNYERVQKGREKIPRVKYKRNSKGELIKTTTYKDGSMLVENVDDNSQKAE